MNGWLKDKSRKKKGFSLAEALVVAGILAILAAVSFPAVIRVRDSLRQTELDRMARSVFIAAQNQLSGLKLCGDLPEIHEEGIPMGTELPSDYAVTMGEAPDTCVQRSGASGKSFTWMDDTAFSPAAAESDGGSYVIEYNRSTGRVYAVYYWEEKGGAFQRDSKFSYPDHFNVYEGMYLRGDENKNNRKAPSVGYYGGEAKTVIDSQTEMDFQVMVKNEADLQIEVRKPDDMAEAVWDTFVFEILVSSRTDTENTAVYKYKASRDSQLLISPEVTQTEGVISASEALFALTLDSLRGGFHFADNFFHICSGDDLTVSVTGYSASGETLYLPRTRTVETNSLFAGLRSGSGQGRDVYIENGRHLQNLSYEVSGLGSKAGGAGEPTGYKVESARLMKDIDWAGKAYEDDNRSWNEICTTNQYSGGELVHFYPISNHKTDLQIFEGNSHVIENLNVTRMHQSGGGASYGQAGLFGDFQYKSGATVPEAAIRNVYLVNPVIKPENSVAGVSCAGSLAGYLKGVNISGCGAYVDGETTEDLGLIYEASGVLASADYVGGLIGGGEDIRVETSFASVKTAGGENAGGFAGIIGGSSEVIKCYSGGRTENGAYVQERPNVTGTAAAGGFAGLVGGSVTIDRSFSTCSVKASDCGPFVGSSEASASELEANLTLTYGVGSSFKREGGAGTANSMGCGPVGENLTGARVPTGEETYPYDETYRAERRNYPYPIWLKAFYGDWPGAAFTGFVYYEKYQLEAAGGNGAPADNEFGFWSPAIKRAGEPEVEGIQTLTDDKPALSDGYGYLSPVKKEVSVRQGGTGRKYELENIPVKHEGVVQYLYVLPWKDVTHVPITSFDGNYGNTAVTFYDTLKFTIDGETYDAYYNPHFAKAIAADQAEALKGPAEALIRTARHLYELGFVSNDGSKHNKAYWKAEWDVGGVFEGYRMERDIDYEVYDGSTYSQDKLELPQGVIGGGKAYDEFSLSFDGGGHTIYHLRIDDLDYGRSFRANAVALFGYVTTSGRVANLDLKYVESAAYYVGYAAGLVYTNQGTISNVRIINPKITAQVRDGGIAAGLAVENNPMGIIENCYVIPEQENYSSEADRYKHIYADKEVSLNNYTNATVTGYSMAAGFAGSNAGTIRNCAAVAAVTAGIEEEGVIRPTDNGSAAGFINSQSNGTITNSYANCYTAGRFAAGFVNDSAGNGIRNCYSLRRVTSTYVNGYAAGFAGADNLTSVADSYAAVSIGYSDNYRIEDGKIYYENTLYRDAPSPLYHFSRFQDTQTNCYFMSWSENYEDVAAPSGLGLTYRELRENKGIPGLDKFERAKSNGSDSEPFSLLLSPVYPFPKAVDLIHYGDWPSYEYVGAELAYFEVYKENDEYTVGMYNEALDLDTLWEDSDGQTPPDIFLDGYGLLFNQEYIEMDNVELGNLIQGTGSTNKKAYLSWEDNNGSDNTTESATNYLKSVFNLMDNEGNLLTSEELNYFSNVSGEEAAFEGEEGNDAPIALALDGRAGNYYFRILPPAAVVTNAYVAEDSMYQPLKIHVESRYEDEGGGSQEIGSAVEKERTFYYTPHFAKSAISVGDPPDEPAELLVRTVRQLCTLGSGNIKNNKNSIARYYDRTFRQEYDIPLGKDGAYAYYYAANAPMTNERNRNNYRWFNSSIGSSAHPFSGIYDGDGYTISGLGSWKDAPDILKQSPFHGISKFNANTALFGYLTGRVGAIEETDLGGTITPHNLVIDKSVVEGGKSIFCSVSKGAVIQGVTVRNSVLIPSSGNAGILLGEGTEQTLIDSCSIENSSVLCGNQDFSYIGIAAGYLNSGAAEIKNLKISDASLKGLDDTTENNATRVGGVAGFISGGKIQNVWMSGTITVQGRRAVGGVAGQILSSQGEVLISDIVMTGAADISQLKANHGDSNSENLYAYNAVGLVAGLSEIGSPITLDNLTFQGSGPGSGAEDGLLKVRNTSQCSGYVGGLLIGSVYRNGSSGVKELNVGNVSVTNAGLYTDKGVAIASNPRCYYGGITGRAANVNIRARGPGNVWDFSGGRILVEPERIDGNSGISGLVGMVAADSSITLPQQVKLPDMEVRAPQGSSVLVSGIVNSTASAAVAPTAGNGSVIYLGTIVTENCDNTGGLTAVLSDKTVFGRNIAVAGREIPAGGNAAAAGGLIQATGNAGAVAGTINTRNAISGISVDRIIVTGNGALGGFAGVMEAGVIENCYANATVTGDGTSPAGGFAGVVNDGTFRQSYASGFVTGRSHVGGFFGTVAKSGIIESCYSTGDVYALPEGSTGGAIGGFGGSLLSDGGGFVVVEQCYSLGRVPEGMAGMKAGGFIGDMDNLKDKFDVLDGMIGSLIAIMKNSEVHNRPEGNFENGRNVWNISQTMDSTTRGEINTGGGYSAAVYNILGYPRYNEKLMEGITPGSDKKAERGAIINAYSLAFDLSGSEHSLLEDTDPDSYFQKVHKPSQENGIMTVWQIKGRDLYWINEPDWESGKSYTAYRVNLDTYAATTDKEARKELITTRSLEVIPTPSVSYERSYDVLNTRTDGWKPYRISSVDHCYFLKEDGARGLPPYNPSYGPVVIPGSVNVDDWSVAEFSAELVMEQSGAGMLTAMKPDTSLPSQNVLYPYPMLENTGSGITTLYHSGYWPEQYRPRYD